MRALPPIVTVDVRGRGGDDDVAVHDGALVDVDVLARDDDVAADVTVEVEGLAGDPHVVSDLTRDAHGLAGDVEVLRDGARDRAGLEAGDDVTVERTLNLEALRPSVEVDLFGLTFGHGVALGLLDVDVAVTGRLDVDGTGSRRVRSGIDRARGSRRQQDAQRDRDHEQAQHHLDGHAARAALSHHRDSRLPRLFDAPRIHDVLLACVAHLFLSTLTVYALFAPHPNMGPVRRRFWRVNCIRAKVRCRPFAGPFVT